MGVYDVESQASGGYGGSGSAAFRGFQQELLRKAALQQMAEEQQRRVAQDALDAEMKRATLANTTENTKSLTEERKAKAAQLALAAATAPLSMGQALTPEQSTALRASGGGGFILGKPATPALEAGGPIETLTPEDVAAMPAVAAQPASETFAGLPKEREARRVEDMQTKAIDHILSTVKKDDPLYEWALTAKTGKTAPAGVLAVKPEPAAKAAERYLDIGTRMQTTPESITPEEQAFAKTYESQHPTEAQKQKDAVTKLNITVGATNERQSKTQLFQMKQSFRSDLKAEDAKLAPDLERVDRAKKVLNSPNFLSDALAAPEVLQIMAGGMGSGLRMTDAELTRVNQAQTKLDQLRGEVAKFGLGTPVTIQETMRAQMKMLIDTVQKARERHAQLLEDTRAKISDADTPEQLDQMVSDFMGKRRETINLEGSPTKPTAADLIKKYGGK